MKIHTTATRSYAELEAIETPKSTFNLTKTLQKVWQRAVDWAVRGDEIRVWKTQTSEGQTIWRLYDPISDRSTCFSSEAEVRIWLEQRYSR